MTVVSPKPDNALDAAISKPSSVLDAAVLKPSNALDMAISVQPMEISDECVGEVWVVKDMSKLAKLIAAIAMGQAVHVSLIARGLREDVDIFSQEQLRDAAIKNLTADKEAVVFHRDGFLFECISWLAAQKTSVGEDIMADPHVRATKQGLDGLSLRVKDGIVTRVVIFEDKCSVNPRDMFRDEIMPVFRIHHSGTRAPELLAAIGELLRQASMELDAIPTAAAAALGREIRSYRAGLTVDSTHSTLAARAALFKGYSDLGDMEADRRLGATFIVDDQDLRAWFAQLADMAVGIINEGAVDNV